MKRIYIFDNEGFFGFIKDFPAVCSSGKTKEIVDLNLDKYFDEYQKYIENQI